MKQKLLLGIASCLMALIGFNASAQSIDEVRIYINPGHGAFCSSCRPMSTIKHGSYTNYQNGDTTGFYESNTNLQKGFGLLEKLIEYGVPFDRSKGARDLTQNLVMSRVKSGDVHEGLYDRSLSDIAAEVEQNNFDMFISIHSNATSGSHDISTHVNHCLYLYRGWDGDPYNPGSHEMAMACWPHSMANEHMNYNWLADPTTPFDTGCTYGNNNKAAGWYYYPSGYYDAENKIPYWIKGDVTFQYGYLEEYTRENSAALGSSGHTRYYGVFDHTVPGFLVEGYDHTYDPARHRAMNWDVCRMEGIDYAKGINDYFGWGKSDNYGYVYGVVRDHTITMTHQYYSVSITSTEDDNQWINPIDKCKPLNGVKVSLYNSAGEEVDTYTTDDEWNGAYVFKGVAPGTYTLKHYHASYGIVEETVTVTANTTSYLNVDMSRALVARQGHFAYGLSSSSSNGVYTLSFKSTGAMDNANIIFTNSSTGEKITIETGAIVKGDNSVTIKATDLGTTDNYSWAVAFENLTSANYELIYSDNIAYNNGSYYARGGVAIDLDQTSANFGTIYTSTGYGQGICSYNPDFTKNGSAILGGSFNSSNHSSPYRIASSNGKVYITDWSDAHGGLWVYDPEAGASVTNMFVGTNDGTGCIKNGSTVTGGGTTGVSFIGEGSSRQMYVFCEDYPSGNAGNQLLRYDLGSADSWSVEPSANFTQMAASSLFPNTNVEVLATDKGVFCSQTRYTNSNLSYMPTLAFMDNSGTVTYNSGTDDTSNQGGCQEGAMAIYGDIFAIVDGYAQGSPTDINIEIYSITWSGTTPSLTYQYEIPMNGTTQISQLAFDHAGNLYAYSRQQGLLVYAVKMPERTTTTAATSTLQGAAPPAVQGHFAYDLAATQSGSDITFTFKSTGAMDNAKIILTDTSTGATHTIETGAIVAGENSINFDATELNTTNTFSWTVAIDNPRSPNYELIYSDNSILYSDGCIGLAIDKDQTSANFGTIYTATGRGHGMQPFNPDLTKKGSVILSNSFVTDGYSCRIEANSGKVYIAEYYTSPGVWVYDPTASTPAVTKVVESTKARNVGFSGEGSNRKMFISANGYLYQYDIGTADTWSDTYTNSFSDATSKLANGDGDLIATDNGIIVSQRRYAPNNIIGTPVFLCFDYSGNITYNSSSLIETLTGSERGAIAISSDLSTFAIVDGWAQDANNKGVSEDIAILIYSVTWSGSTPTFTYQYSIPLTGTQRVDQMEFDHADNLYVGSQQQGLLVYAIKTEARTTTTKANSTVQGALPPAVRGHYAYDLKMETTDDYYAFTFYSTGDVDQAYIVLVPTMAGYAEQVINIGAVTKGENRYSLDRAAMKAYRDGKDGYSYYNWAVRFDNPASPTVEKTIIDNSIQYGNGTTYARGGVAIDLDEASANFGTIYASTGYAQGVYVYEPDLTRQGDPILGDSFNSANRHSPFRLASSEGKLYIADWSDAHGGVWMYDPKAGETVTNVFSGTYGTGTGGQIVNNGVAVGGGVTSMAFVGEGAERKMFVLCEDYPTGNAGNTVLRYDLGAADIWGTAPSANFGKIDTWLSLDPTGSTNVEIIPAENGIFVASSGNYTPAFVYSDVDGNILYNQGTSMPSHSYNYGAGIAIHGNTLAVVDGNSDIKIYSIEWNTPEIVTYSNSGTTSVPTLTYQYTIGTDYTSVSGEEITQMAFDPAGNLYLYSQADGLVSYTLKSDARQTTTNHATDILVPADIVGIEDVLAGEDDAEAVYYNLQGYKIAADELNPGTVYIKVAGGKATKIVYSDK